MENDLNTPEALAIIWEMVDSQEPDSAKAAAFLLMDRVLGLGLSEAVAQPLLVPKEIKELADARLKARKRGDWDDADKLREELEGRGWTALDTKDGYTLEKIDT